MSDNLDTNSTSQEASVDKVDEIANLLAGDEVTNDSEESVGQPEESTSVNESEEEVAEDDAEITAEDDAEEVEDDEVEESWGGALGVGDENVVLDDDGNLVGINTKVGDELATVSVSDLVQGYQTNKYNTKKSQALSEERKVFEDERQSITGEYKEKLEYVQTMSEFLNKKLVGEYDAVNWEQLRVEDPAEYAALRQDYASRAQDLQKAKDAIAEERTSVDQVAMEQFQRDQVEYGNKEFQKVISNNPSWADKETFQKDYKELQGFTNNAYGFTEAEFADVRDSRLVEMMKDAKAYRDGVTLFTKKLKKKVPKFQKSKRRVASKSKVTKLDQLTNKAKTSQGSEKRSAQMDAIAELLTSAK